MRSIDSAPASTRSEQEQVVDESEESLRVAFDGLDELTLFGPAGRFEVTAQQFGEADDGGERRAQFVRDGGDELAAHLGEFEERPVLLFGLVACLDGVFENVGAMSGQFLAFGDIAHHPQMVALAVTEGDRDRISFENATVEHDDEFVDGRLGLLIALEDVGDRFVLVGVRRPAGGREFGRRPPREEAGCAVHDEHVEERLVHHHDVVLAVDEQHADGERIRRAQ